MEPSKTKYNLDLDVSERKIVGSLTEPLKRSLTRKEYFITDKLKTNYPWDFIHSTNANKSVHVIACTLFKEEPNVETKIMEFSVPKYSSLHANFIHRGKYLDSFVCYCNQPLEKRKKYQQMIKDDYLEIWFKYYDGSPLDMENVHFILELMLEF